MTGKIVRFFFVGGFAQILMDPKRAGKWNQNQFRNMARRPAQEGIEMYHFITKILTKTKIVSQKGNYQSLPAERGQRAGSMDFLAHLGPVGR